MELTLTSAFSTGGLVGHLAYILLILSMIMRRMVWLRILVIASASVGIAYSFFWLKDPVSSFWETLLVAVNVTQLLITWRQNSLAKFSGEEISFAKTRLRGLQPGEQRRVIDAGHWQDVECGTILTKEGEEPTNLYYLSDGEAEVSLDGSILANCGPGTYIGEMSLVGSETASATVKTTSPARIWCISRDKLSYFERKQPTWLAVLEAGISRDMRKKLLVQNSSLASKSS
jgi:hypothetical protein